MYTLDSGHMLLTIAQSIPHILVLQFGKRNRELLCTFIFKKLAYYDVIIPGRDSEIHWLMPNDATKQHTNF